MLSVGVWMALASVCASDHRIVVDGREGSHFALVQPQRGGSQAVGPQTGTASEAVALAPRSHAPSLPPWLEDFTTSDGTHSAPRTSAADLSEQSEGGCSGGRCGTGILRKRRR